ncbi:MAG: radical SAM protein [Tabrizicola sp.]|nr:radical SAM protein [Tabrizicola sp.]
MNAGTTTRELPDALADGQLRALRLQYDEVNTLTESSLRYRDPEEILAAALQILPEPDEEAGDGFIQAMAASKALREGRMQRAEALAQKALVGMQNNLHVQSLLARATGTPDKPREGLFCRSPFENLETAPNGEVYFCCPAWLPKPIGNMKQDGAEAIWNSPAARDIRASIHDGSYRHCSRLHCPKLSGAGLERTEDIRRPDLAKLAAARRVRLERGPANVILSHDRSCNLACPSCRSGLVLARKDEQSAMNALVERVIFPLLADARRLRITASGDPFGSGHFQHVLRQLFQSGNAHLKVDLQTNGLLLTPALWQRLNLEGHVGSLIVSVDAAEAETYAKVRWPGSFEVLQKNLSFFKDLRAENRIARFRLDFVVQTQNYQEMSDFIGLARELGCDGVKFQMIRSWGAMSPTDFAEQHIGDRGHPAYRSFVAALAVARRQAPFAEFWGMQAALQDADA